MKKSFDHNSFPFIPVNEPIIGEREKELVTNCLDTGWISSEGPYVGEFEEKFAKTVDRNYGISCSNGTAALEIAIAALKIGIGDEVIIPTFTIISCSNAIVKVGAKPIPVDVDPETWTMNIDQVRKSITKKTVAIMAVHIYGLPVDLDPIIEIAKKNKLFLIEDSAEMIGGKYKGKPCGSFGDVSTFSFYPNKAITTGEGGMIVTNNSEIAERSRSLRNLCFQSEKRFIHEEIGWNYRMSNIQAAIGIAQLEKLEETTKKKIWIGNYYNKLLKNINHIQTQPCKKNYADNIYWVYGILIDDKYGESEHIRAKLKELNIGTRPFFYPIHLQPVYIKNKIFSKDYNFPISEDLYKRGLYLPSGLTLNSEKIELVSEAIKKIFGIF